MLAVVRCLARHRAGLFAHRTAAAQHITEIGQRFAQIAASLALDEEGDDEELELRVASIALRPPQQAFEIALSRGSIEPNCRADRIADLVASS